MVFLWFPLVSFGFQGRNKGKGNPRKTQTNQGNSEEGYKPIECHQSCLLLRRLLDNRKVIFQPTNSWRRGCGLIGPAAIQQAEHRSGSIRFRKLLRLSHPAKGKATQPSKYKYKGYKSTNIQSSSAWGQWRQGYLSHLICFKKSKYQPTTLVHLVGA